MEVLNHGKKKLWSITRECRFADCEALLKISETDLSVNGYDNNPRISYTCPVCHRESYANYKDFSPEHYRRLTQNLPEF